MINFTLYRWMVMYQLMLFLLFFFCNFIKASDTVSLQLAEDSFVELNTDEIDIFTQESLKDLIATAKQQDEPALFCMIDNDARFVYDADSFWTYAKQNEDEVINPSNRQPISHVSLISVCDGKAQVVVDTHCEEKDTDLQKKQDLLQCYINAHSIYLKSEDKIRAKMALAEKLYRLKHHITSHALLEKVKKSSVLEGLDLARMHYFLGLHCFRGTIKKADLKMAENHMNEALKIVGKCKQMHATQKSVSYKNMFASHDLQKYENFEQKAKKAVETIRKKKDTKLRSIIEKELVATGI